MPELPEVETVRRGLPGDGGAVIAGREVNRPDLRWPLPERMADRLTGARVTGCGGGRSTSWPTSTGETLLIHLGMSGRMLVSGAMLGPVPPRPPRAAEA
jgi:formamidopyrimidine-DNA glycosylase